MGCTVSTSDAAESSIVSHRTQRSSSHHHHHRNHGEAAAAARRADDTTPINHRDQSPSLNNNNHQHVGDQPMYTATSPSLQPSAPPSSQSVKEISPINGGRTVCSIGFVDALPRYTVPLSRERRSKTNNNNSIAASNNSIVGCSMHSSTTGASPGHNIIIDHSHVNVLTTSSSSNNMTPAITSARRIVGFTATESGVDGGTSTSAPITEGDEDDVVITVSPRDTAVQPPSTATTTTPLGRHHSAGWTVNEVSTPMTQESDATTTQVMPTSARSMVMANASGSHRPSIQTEVASSPVITRIPTSGSLLLPGGAAGDDAAAQQGFCPSPYSQKSSYGGPRDCSICLSTVAGCSVVVTACLHTFHYECAKEWLSKHDGSCPECRTKVCIESFTYPAECEGDHEFAEQVQRDEVQGDPRRRLMDA